MRIVWNFLLSAYIFFVNGLDLLVPFSSHFHRKAGVVSTIISLSKQETFLYVFCSSCYHSFNSFNTLDKFQSFYSSLMMLITGEMVPITPFQPLCDGGCPGPGYCCIPHRTSLLFKGQDVSMAMASSWQRLNVTLDFVCSFERI